MMRLASLGYWGVLLLVLTSCASPQTRYLRQAVNHEPESVVVQHLGPPTAVWLLDDGETLWSYRADQCIWAYWHNGFGDGRTAGLTVEGPQLTVLPGARCTEYLLRFDREHILLAWSRQPCRGFEPMPGSNP
jgi:hypothetical protein